MNENDPGRLADERDREASELQGQSDRLGATIDETRADWERKRRDENVPGAPAPEGKDDPPTSASPATSGTSPSAEIIDEDHDEE